jgi:hypothetical protein
MLGRFISLVSVSVVCMAACGGGAFSSAHDEGEGGESGSASGGTSSSTGGKASGGKATGGTLNQAGTTTQGGSSTGGGATGGGMSSSGTSSSGGMINVSGSGGSVVAFMCESPDDCPVSNTCHEPICEGGACDEVHVPDGPYTLQVPGDCQRIDCEEGEEKLTPDLNDSNDNNECTIDSCSQNGIATHKARLGEVCQNGAGICNAEGTCALCNRDACPLATTCKVAVCINNTCQLTYRTAGDLCPLVSPMDPNDQYGQCNGAGACVDCVTSGGCGECCVCSLDQHCIPA